MECFGLKRISRSSSSNPLELLEGTPSTRPLKPRHTCRKHPCNFSSPKTYDITLAETTTLPHCCSTEAVGVKREGKEGNFNLCLLFHTATLQREGFRQQERCLPSYLHKNHQTTFITVTAREYEGKKIKNL